MSPRVLILGVDWHGDVAPHLAMGFRQLAPVTVRYLLHQRRQGVRSRVHDELIHLPRIGHDLRKAQLRRASRRIERDIKEANADLVISLAPELLSRESVETILGASAGVWWFCDDPFDFQKRGMGEQPSVLEYLDEPSSVAYVAHPQWAHSEAAGSRYLPYASCYEPGEGDTASARTERVIVVGSPRDERTRLLSELSPILGDRLDIWGWGRRARAGLTPSARPFRSRLRGAGTLGRHEVEALFRAGGVVLNLQDAQMVGAWNPQTFDLMSLAIPQVVWNTDPVPIFDNPPPWGTNAAEIAVQAESLLADRGSHDWRAGAEEVATRHRWVHRAETVLRNVMEAAL